MQSVRKGNFSGTIALEEVTIPVRFKSNIEATELEFAVTSSVNLGTVPEGETATAEIEISNEGSPFIETVTFESESMTVSTDDIEVPVGESETAELEFSDITGSGAVTVTAESASQEATESVQVNVETIPDLYADAEQLRTDLNDLQSQVESDENQNILNTASHNISQIQNEYNAGNYDEAQRIYDATEAQLEDVRYDVARNPGTGEDSTDSTPTDTGEQVTARS